jgi:GNAT superfamily N-acetyltransferase
MHKLSLRGSSCPLACQFEIRIAREPLSLSKSHHSWSIKIRRAKGEDAAGACSVIRGSIAELCHLDHGGSEERLSKWLANKTIENVRGWILGSHFLVAEQGARIAGVAAMTYSGRITLNYVDPAARFRGVSKALLLSLEEKARTLGITECVLESTQTALRFYLALGYAESERSYARPLTPPSATVLSKRLRASEK